MKKINLNCSGIGFMGLLTIAFIVLKLCDVIDWSWWWVLAPLWAGYCYCDYYRYYRCYCVFNY